MERLVKIGNRRVRIRGAWKRWEEVKGEEARGGEEIRQRGKKRGAETEERKKKDKKGERRKTNRGEKG